MKTAGGIIAMIAGIFATLAAVITLLVGGIASGFNANNAATVVTLGWLGLAFAFLTIVFGAIAITAKTKAVGSLLIICSVGGAIAGGTLVAICMSLAFVGGLLAVFGKQEVGTVSATV